jgi:hypothetical protein
LIQGVKVQCWRAALNQLLAKPGHNFSAKVFEGVIIVKVF